MFLNFPEPVASPADLNSISSEATENVRESADQHITSNQAHSHQNEEKSEESQVRKHYLRSAKNRSHIQQCRNHVQYMWVMIYLLDIKHQNFSTVVILNENNSQLSVGCANHDISAIKFKQQFTQNVDIISLLSYLSIQCK